MDQAGNILFHWTASRQSFPTGSKLFYFSLPIALFFFFFFFYLFHVFLHLFLFFLFIFISIPSLHLLQLTYSVWTLLCLCLFFFNLFYCMTLYCIYLLTYFNVLGCSRFFFFFMSPRTTASCWIRLFYITWPHSAILSSSNRLCLDRSVRPLAQPVNYCILTLNLSTCVAAVFMHAWWSAQCGIHAVITVAY